MTKHHQDLAIHHQIQPTRLWLPLSQGRWPSFVGKTVPSSPLSRYRAKLSRIHTADHSAASPVRQVWKSLGGTAMKILANK